MSEKKFTVGDKVEHYTRGAGEIAYGPFVGWAGNNSYLVKYSDGRSVGSSPEHLTARPAFKAGDKVTAYGAAYTVVSGPYSNVSEPFFVVVDADGQHTTAELSYMKPNPDAAPISVGDRVKIVAGAFLSSTIGKTGEVTSVTQTWGESTAHGVHPYLVRVDGRGEVYVREVERVVDADTETIDGITYDLSAQYEDSDGDAWKIARIDGVVRAATTTYRAPSGSSHTLQYVASAYGPLTRV